MYLRVRCVLEQAHVYSHMHTLIQSLRPEVNRLRTAVDKGTSNREQYVHKFCTQLDKDIAELDKEAKEIKNEAQVSAH